MSGKILVMGAMEDVELNLLKEKLENQTQRTEGKYHFYEGNIYDKQVVLVNTQIGSINATAATTLAIKHYDPRLIIIQGIAGSHSEEVHSKDIVIANEIIQINSFVIPNATREELPYDLEDFTLQEPSTIPQIKTNEVLVSYASQISYPHGKIHIGRIGSGDVWNKHKKAIKLLHQKYHTLCEDMESYAIGKIASNYQIPLIGIRAISNNELLEEKYDRNVGKYSQEFVLDYIKIIPQ